MNARRVTLALAFLCASCSAPTEKAERDTPAQKPIDATAFDDGLAVELDRTQRLAVQDVMSLHDTFTASFVEGPDWPLDLKSDDTFSELMAQREGAQTALDEAYKAFTDAQDPALRRFAADRSVRLRLQTLCDVERSIDRAYAKGQQVSDAVAERWDEVREAEKTLADELMSFARGTERTDRGPLTEKLARL